jgi:hypothetical protein
MEASDDVDEVQLYLRGQRRRRRIRLALVTVIAGSGCLAYFSTRPTPCEAFVAELCEGLIEDCQPLLAGMQNVGVSEDECRDAHEVLDEALADAPRDVEPHVKVRVLFMLLEPHVDPAELDRVAKGRGLSGAG